MRGLRVDFESLNLSALLPAAILAFVWKGCAHTYVMFRSVRNARKTPLMILFEFTHDFEMVPITPIVTFEVPNVA